MYTYIKGNPNTVARSKGMGVSVGEAVSVELGGGVDVTSGWLFTAKVIFSLVADK
jgi:hypothetical protein